MEAAELLVEDAELTSLQSRLHARLAECQQIRGELAAARSERDVAQRACAAGLQAARVQMARMRSELETIRQQRQQASSAVPAATEELSADFQAEETLEAPDDEPPPGVGSLGGFEREATPSVPSQTVTLSAAGFSQAPLEIDADDERLRREALRLEARALRHAVSKWRHQAEVLEAERPKRAKELLQLRAELTHVHDVLESTQHAVRHHEVEQGFLAACVSAGGNASARQLGSRDASGTPQGCGGGYSSMEAQAERVVRERCEQKNTQLCGKARRLGGVLAAQQLLARRLEERLVVEEGGLERKDLQIAHESQLHQRFQGILRTRSDSAVMLALSVGAGALRASQKQPGAGPALSRSVSLPLLAPIGERR